MSSQPSANVSTELARSTDATAWSSHSTTQPPRVIELTEFRHCFVDRSELSEDEGLLLWEKYGNQVAVETPSFKTGSKWRLTAQGWMGYIPLSQDLGIRLLPKVDLGNIFRMLEYAFRLENFRFFETLIDCRSLEEFYERLANVLARRVLDRARRGYYRAYLGQRDQLPFVRGRLDMGHVLRTPWSPKPLCEFEEHTADIEENQILTWTLWRITQSGVCSERVLPAVRQAFRSLQGVTSLEPIAANRCVGRLYNRLNDDYRPLHALSRFFLEQSGPSHHIGDRQVMPFLIDMDRLFELFVAEWLTQKLPPKWTLKRQEEVPLGEDRHFTYRIDLVLYDNETGDVQAVIDTKYKAVDKPGMDDIQQVHSYAHSKGSRQAVLVYPVAPGIPLNETKGGIHLRSLVFALGDDLEAAGERFLAALLG